MKKAFLTLGALLAFGLASAQTDSTRTDRVRKVDNSTRTQTQANDVRQRRTTTQQPGSTTGTTRRPTTVAPTTSAPSTTTSPSTTAPTTVSPTTTSPPTNGTNNNNSRGSNKNGTNNPAGTSGSGNPTRP